VLAVLAVPIFMVVLSMTLPARLNRTTNLESDRAGVREVKLPLGTNARAKMQGVLDGFVKLYCRPGTGTVLGGVVVAPRASELILPVSVAVQHGLTVDQLAHSFTIYPSISGSITEAARQLHRSVQD
jgi:dihydrolipoamide dehydrogenase